MRSHERRAPSALCPDSARIAAPGRETNVPVAHMTTPARLRQHVRYVTQPDGTRLAWAEVGRRPDRRQGRQLADPSRVRVGEPGLEALDPVLFRRTARFVRYDERGCGMSDWQAGRADARSVGRRSRGRDRRRAAAETGDAARHLAGRGDLHPLRDRGIRSGSAGMILYGGYARGAGAAGRRRPSAAYRADDRARAGGLGERQPDLPPGLHVALHSRRHAGAAAVVQRPVPEDDDRARSSAALLEARADVDISASLGRGAHARRSSCTRATTK